MTTLTDLETKFVENMISNDFGEAPDHKIWTDCWDSGTHRDFMQPNQIGGVMASLVKKGVIDCSTDQWDTFNHRSDNTCWFTEAGQKLLGINSGEDAR